MIDYQVAIKNLSSIKDLSTDDGLIALFENVSSAVTSLVGFKYNRLDKSDAEDIGNRIAVELVDRVKREPTFKVKSWPAYLDLLIKDVYKKEYKYYGQLFSISQISTDTEEESDIVIPYNEFDTDSLVDFKSSVESLYKKYQKLVNNTLLESEDLNNLIERIVVHSVTIDESILNVLSEPYRRIAKANYAILRSLVKNYKQEGLLVSRVV